MSEIDIGVEDLEIRGRLEIEDIVRLQINRCNVSIINPDPEVFNANVMVLMDNLPAHKRAEVLDRKSDYEITVETDSRRISITGQRVGKIKDYPPNKEKVVDYHLLYRVVLDAFADCGLTWKIEKELIELGKVEKKKAEPTPYLPEEKKDV